MHPIHHHCLWRPRHRYANGWMLGAGDSVGSFGPSFLATVLCEYAALATASGRVGAYHRKKVSAWAPSILGLALAFDCAFAFFGGFDL